jgi:hypothetical protein
MNNEARVKFLTETAETLKKSYDEVHVNAVDFPGHVIARGENLRINHKPSQRVIRSRNITAALRRKGGRIYLVSPTSQHPATHFDLIEWRQGTHEVLHYERPQFS